MFPASIHYSTSGRRLREGVKLAKSISEPLLNWYDLAARDMPWRVSPGDRASGVQPEPYHVWLSEVMLQQTTVAAVRAYFQRFTMRWPDVHALAAAQDADVMAEWAGLGYYARARNLLKCARAVSADGGTFPGTYDALIKLPGIGPYTASAICAIAFDAPETVLDGNVERVMARLFAIETPLPAAKPELHAAATSQTPQKRAGDYAQAVMDLGATICTPRNPSCLLCPVSEQCDALAQNIAANLPRKTPKAEKPTRVGHVYFARRADGAALVETRPDRGLLGGMIGFVGSDWTTEAPAFAPPFTADWQRLEHPVTHVFTHFKLNLTVHTARAPMETEPLTGYFQAPADYRSSALPTVFRKVHSAAMDAMAVQA